VGNVPSRFAFPARVARATNPSLQGFLSWGRMDMAMLQTVAILAAATSLTACQQTPPQPPAPAVAPAEGPVTKPPAPAFKPGMTVIDRSGAGIGVIQAVAETPGGLNVVVEIDGKLVGVLPSRLELRGETAVSSQTKAQILASAGAPP
jgi:hypothetical protein